MNRLEHVFDEGGRPKVKRSPDILEDAVAAQHAQSEIADEVPATRRQQLVEDSKDVGLTCSPPPEDDLVVRIVELLADPWIDERRGEAPRIALPICAGLHPPHRPSHLGVREDRDLMDACCPRAHALALALVADPLQLAPTASGEDVA